MPPEFDTTTAHSARVYDFHLGGTDHFAVDRETGLKAMQSWPAALAFGGLDLADPGVVLVSQWRPPASPRPAPAEVNWYGGVGRKP
jgi:S-adenosyl methyltransferase